MMLSATRLSATGGNTGSVKIYDFLAENLYTLTRATSGTFVGSNGLIQTAAIDSARIDYGRPSGSLELRGLMVEPASTNLFSFPEDQSNAYWTKDRGSIIATNGASPMAGVNTACTFREDGGNAIHSVGKQLSVGGNAFSTCSVFVKKFVSAPMRRYAQLHIHTGEAQTYGVVVDLLTGLVTTVQDTISNASARSHKVEDHGDFWKIIVTAFNNGAFGTVIWYLSPSLISNPVPNWNGRPLYQGDNTSTLTFWGFNLFAGQDNVSYTATTRSADVANLTVPAGVTRVKITYDDATTENVRVTPLSSKLLPTTTKRYKEIKSYIPLPDDVEYFTRAGIVDPDARWRLQEFFRWTKDVGIWNGLCYVPCLSDIGGLHQFGGSVNVTESQWTINGAGTVTTNGVEITKSGFANALLSRQSLPNLATSPAAFGVIVAQNVTPDTVTNATHFAAPESTTTQLLGAANAGDAVGDIFHNFYVYGNNVTAVGGQHNIMNTYRQGQLVAVSTNGTTNFDTLVAGKMHQRNFGSAISGGNHKVRFYPSSGEGQAGYIQGAFLYDGMMSASPSIGVWEKFQNAVKQTLMSNQTNAGLRRIHFSGQSNGTAGENLVWFSKVATTTAMGPTSISKSGIGGRPITEWVSELGSNVRTSQYQSDFNLETGIMHRDRVGNYGKTAEYLVWVHGESDSESYQTSIDYLPQLTTLIQWIRADALNPNLIVIVVQIDYEYIYRDNSAQADFVVSGFAGGLSALNGSYAIQALASNTSPYVWQKGDYRISQVAGVWSFTQISTGTVLASAPSSGASSQWNNVAIGHPQIATGWVDGIAGEAVSPAFTSSFVGNLEIVRKAQRDICNVLDNCYTFDSRGYNRNYVNPEPPFNTDNVHLYAGTQDGFPTLKKFMTDLAPVITAIPIP